MGAVGSYERVKGKTQGRHFRKTPMNCETARNYLPLHAGGDLPDPPLAFLEHLSQCPECRRELDTFRAMRHALGECGKSPSPLTYGEFMRGVMDRTVFVRSAEIPKAGFRRLLAPAAAAAVVAALVLGIVFSTSSTGRASSSTNSSFRVLLGICIGTSTTRVL